MSNLKIGMKMILAFAFVSAIALVIGIVGLNGTSELNDVTEDIAGVRVPRIESLMGIAEAQTAILAGERGLINRRMMEPSLRRAQYDYIDDAQKRAGKYWELYMGIPRTAEEQEKWDAFVPKWDEWKKNNLQVIELSRQKDAMIASGMTLEDPQIAEIDKKVFEAAALSKAALLESRKALDVVVSGNIKKAEEKMALATTTNSTVRTAIGLTIAVGIVLAMAIAVVFSRRISRPMAAMAQAAQSLAMGDVDQNIEVKSGDEIGELGMAFQKMIEAQKEIAGVAENIGKGNLTVTVKPRSERDVVSKSLLNTVKTLNRLQTETETLINSVREGNLKNRGNASAFEGGFREMINGINNLIEAFVAPINVTAAYVDKISRGEIPTKITDAYQGDFNTIKNNLNQCIDAVNQLVSDMNGLVAAALDGRLSTRADASKHHGDYARIVQGVNRTLDAVLEPVNEASKALEALSQRDLTARVTGDYKGDHAKIKDSLNATAEALSDAMNQVAEATHQVANASNEIASSSQAVAEGASEQASSLEETSSSLEEMSSMTRQNADNAQEANVMVKQASNAANEGASAMKLMNDAMVKIRDAAKGTAAIIKDINEIAFQTNLLALNAAVEAARAGEAGRGFAVVAEEVRALALRSKEAAKQTEELINQSVSLAGDGEGISRQVDEKLALIVNYVEKVTAIVGEIAVASQEQARGIDQVNTAVAQMDKVTQQNAANAEESSSASQELSSQSQELLAMVASFKLDRQTTSSNMAMQKKNAAGSRARSARNAPRYMIKNEPVNDRKQIGNDMHITPEEIIPLESDPDFAKF